MDFEEKSKQGLNGYSKNMLRLFNKYVVNYWLRYIGHTNLDYYVTTGPVMSLMNWLNGWMTKKWATSEVPHTILKHRAR